MKIRLIWPGRTKEAFIREGMNKYAELIRPFASLAVDELKEEKGAAKEQVLRREGERILKLQKPFVLLDEKGESLTSVGFARFIEKKGSSANFVVGGAYGVSEDVRAAAESSISLSRMTLTHEMARLILMEQIYRALTIINKRGYHH